MNEITKTLTYAAIAVLLLGGAWLAQSKSSDDSGVKDSGEKFFPDFSDPLEAASLEVIDFDEATATIKPFRVAQVNGVWSIPSHEGYPADAQKQLGEAATALVDLEKLGAVSDDPSTHELYGVIEPDPAKLASGATGVGKRITLESKNGDKLAQLIIGKADADKPELHYVRVPGQDRVYTAKVPTDKLSTKFEDWIEADLLKLSAWDVKQVTIKDHSLDLLQRTIDPRAEIVVGYDNKDNKWKLADMKDFGPRGQPVPVKLAEDEELDDQKLNDLKNALHELKIVDVARKPAELSADLRAGEEAIKSEAATTRLLYDRGFAFGPSADGGVELYSNEGEVRCGMNNGVEYLLRFGAIAGQGQADDEKKDNAKGADPAKTKDAAADAGVNRFVLVTTRFNEDLVAKPELKPLPELPAKDAAPAKDQAAPAKDAAAPDKGAAPPAKGNPPAAKEPAKGQTNPATTPKQGASKQDAPKQNAAKQDAPNGGGPDGDGSDAAGEPANNAGHAKTDGRKSTPALAVAYQDAKQKTNAKGAPSKSDSAKSNTDAAKSDAPKADAKSAETKPKDTKATDAKTTDAKSAPAKASEQKADTAKDEKKPDAAEPAKTPAEPGIDIEQERKQVEADNKRLQDEYDKKVKEGKDKVKELNDRFANWYYVISDSTYKKIHLSRDTIIKKKTKPAGEGDTPTNLDALKGALPGAGTP